MDWYENLTGDEIPPEWMWPFDHLVAEWLEDVKARRADRFDSNKDDDSDSGSAVMMKNEYARGRG